MKKLIAISVMLALVAGAVFAQDLSIAAHAEFGTNILYSDTATGNASKSEPIRMGGTNYDQFALTVSKSGENAGGYMRFRNNSDNWGEMVHVWWQPVDIFKFKVGSGDGDWGAAKISGWGWTQQAKLGGKLAGAAFDNRGFANWDGQVAFMPNTSKGGEALQNSTLRQMQLGLINFDKSVGFYPGTGWNTWRLGFSVYPMDGLDINLAFVSMGGNQPGDQGGFSAPDIINHTHINVQYALSGIGTINVSAILGTGKNSVITADKAKSEDGGPTTKLFASFYMNAIDNLELDFGVAYQLPGKDAAKGTLTYPIEIGLAATYSMGDFGVKLRGASTLMGAYKPDGGSKVNGPMSFAVDILPYYNMGSTTIYFQAGINMAMYDSKAKPYNKNSLMGWFVNPYVKFGPGGGIDMWIGFKAWGTSGLKAYGDSGNKDPALRWAIPLTVNLWMQ